MAGLRNQKKQRIKAGKIIKAAAALLALVFGEIVRETHSFRMTRYRAVSGKIKGSHKILFLSDLHSQVYGKGNRRLLRAVRKEKPELVFIGGDMLVGKSGCDYRAAADFVKRLPALCPVYYANGNHEQRMKEAPEKYGGVYKAYQQELAAAGVHFLENASETVVLDGTTISLTGLEIPQENYTRFTKKSLPESVLRSLPPAGKSEEREPGAEAHEERKPGEEAYEERKPGAEAHEERKPGMEAPAEGSPVYRILLAHNPSYLKEYLAWGADLVLCGHFHGGIVRIPWFRGVLSPDLKLFPKYAGGCYREGNQTAVVSRGLGNHTIPVRLFNPAEVVVLGLSGEPDSRKDVPGKRQTRKRRAGKRPTGKRRMEKRRGCTGSKNFV